MTQHDSNPHPVPVRDAAVVGAKDAARLLSISLSTLNRQLDEMPPRVRLSARRFGWRVSDLYDWLDARRECVTAPATRDHIA